MLGPDQRSCPDRWGGNQVMGCLRVRDRNLDCQGCALPGRACDGDDAAQCLDSVGKSGEAGSPGGIGAAHSVVTDGQLQAAIVRPDIDMGDGRVCVLGRICQRFTDDVIRADLNRFGQACWEIDLDLDGDRRSPGQSLKRRCEAALGQDRGVDTTRNFSQVVQRICETFGYAGELRLHLPQIRRNLRLGGTQVEQYRYEPLLDPIMEVTLNSAPGFIGRSDNPPSGRQEFVPAPR